MAVNLFDRPGKGDRAVLLHVEMPAQDQNEDLEEFRDLALSAGLLPVEVISAARRRPDPAYFVGSGKAEEVRAAVIRQQAQIVLVNAALTPAQERNLERVLQCRVADRVGLILDIFAQRARSHEGKLQVELAQLKHLSTRLVRGWTHLERQVGGIGVRGGPGETQLELDRRLINERLKQVKKRLEKVQRQRASQRRARQRADVPLVSLVGYTNAGKSTLFNCLTKSQTYVADQLFATLDPTLRRVDLRHGKTAVLADTVGFIRHLPHSLIAAFRSTLEETVQAHLLLHVVDGASEQRDDNITQVNTVLAEIGAAEIPQIEVMNKLDQIEKVATPRVDRDAAGVVRRVWVSALTGAGLDALRSAITERLQAQPLYENTALTDNDAPIMAN